MKLLGHHIDTCSKVIPRKEILWRMVKPTYNSLTWRGSEFATPTSLDFETVVIKADMIQNNMEMSNSAVTIEGLHYIAEELAYNKAVFINNSDFVVDASERFEVELRYTNTRDTTTFVSRAKVWPRIEGLTTLAKDYTL